MEMVKIIAQIEGVWNRHLAAFNYSKLGTVYLAEMNQLSGDVSGEYKKGIFVVKVGKTKFNQVARLTQT